MSNVRYEWGRINLKAIRHRFEKVPLERTENESSECLNEIFTREIFIVEEAIGEWDQESASM